MAKEHGQLKERMTAKEDGGTRVGDWIKGARAGVFAMFSFV